jgi:hypothetical protein
LSGHRTKRFLFRVLGYDVRRMRRVEVVLDTLVR